MSLLLAASRWLAYGNVKHGVHDTRSYVLPLHPTQYAQTLLLTKWGHVRIRSDCALGIEPVLTYVR